MYNLKLFYNENQAKELIAIFIASRITAEKNLNRGER